MNHDFFIQYLNVLQPTAILSFWFRDFNSILYLDFFTITNLFLLIGPSVTAYKEHHVENAVCEFPDGYSYRSIHIFIDAFLISYSIIAF